MKITTAWKNLKQAGIKVYLEKGDRGNSREENPPYHLVKYVSVLSLTLGPCYMHVTCCVPCYMHVTCYVLCM